MSLLFMDGFDIYGRAIGSLINDASLDLKWVNTGTFKIGNDRTGKGGNSLGFFLDTCVLFSPNLCTEDDTLMTGVGVYIRSTGTWTVYPLAIYTDDIKSIEVQVDSNGMVSLVGSFGTVNTANAAISLSAWHFMELNVKAHATAGTYDLRVDGVSLLNGTGNTVSSSGKTHHNKIRLASDPASGLYSGHIYFDDLYVLDGTGLKLNGPLGDTQIFTIRPNSDVTTDWDVVPTGNHWEAVDNLWASGGSDRVYSRTSGEQDLWGYESINTSKTAVEAVQVVTVTTDSETNSYPIKILAASSGNTVKSDSKSAGTEEWDSVINIWEKDPDGIDWNFTTINSTSFGVEVV